MKPISKSEYKRLLAQGAIAEQRDEMRALLDRIADLRAEVSRLTQQLHEAQQERDEARKELEVIRG